MLLVLTLPRVYAADGDNSPGDAGTRNERRGITGSGCDKQPDAGQHIDKNQPGLSRLQ